MFIKTDYFKNRNQISIRIFILLCFIVIFSNSCIKKEYVYLPIGRLPDAGNEVTILINESEQNIDIIKDIHGGSWFKIPSTLLTENSKVTLLINKKNKYNILEKNERNLELWLKPSEYIDCDNPVIIDKANELTTGLNSNEDKIQAILDFVYYDIQFKVVHGMEKDFKKASESLMDGYGICMNKSRIFVALCRAVNIPSRVICGSVIQDDGTDHHHDWVEVYDEKNKKWFTIDPTFPDGLDTGGIKYIDLIYNIDDNPMFPYKYWADDYAEIDGGISVLFPERNLHWRTGAVGYTVVENKLPEYLLIKIEYTVEY